MAASNEWWEYHLTPSGWTDGTEKTDFAYTEVTPPLDRVLTIKHTQYIASSHSRMDESIGVLFGSLDEPTVKRLQAEYGEWPINSISESLKSKFAYILR
jgi:hypothetical protein